MLAAPPMPDRVLAQLRTFPPLPAPGRTAAQIAAQMVAVTEAEVITALRVLAARGEATPDSAPDRKARWRCTDAPR